MFKLTTFTPAEAAKISGVSVVLQRGWRRRGFLPREEGHARFDAFAVAELMILERLAHRGIGPQAGKAIAGTCAAAAVASVLDWYRDAYAGEPEALGGLDVWTPEALGRVERLANDRALEAWLIRARWWREKVLLDRGISRTETGRYAVWWADGSVGFYGSFDELDAAMDAANGAKGGVGVLLSPDAIGKELLMRAGRPLVTVRPEGPYRDPAPEPVAGTGPAPSLTYLMPPVGEEA